MINSYYSKETYFKIKKDNNKYLALFICLLVFGLAFLFLSAFLINTKTVTIIKIIDSVVLSSCLILSFYFLLMKYIPGVRRNKFLYRLLTVERFEGRLKVLDIKSPYLVKRGITAYEIEAKDEDGKVISCFYEDINPLEFKKDDEIEVTLAMNFIVMIRENNHE